jgi:thiol:disulfide interchange protein
LSRAVRPRPRTQNEAGWILNDYEGAVRQAKLEDKLVFADFTGYTCTNCRWMEANMFPQPEVANELKKFVLVRLCTDGAGELFERQQKMQEEKFGTVALPLYAVVRADGKSVATFSGLTRDSSEFVKFLRSARS